MDRKPWIANAKSVAENKAAQAARVRALVAARGRARPEAIVAVAADSLPSVGVAATAANQAVDPEGIDFSVATRTANSDLRQFIRLYDLVTGHETPIHLALMWPHCPTPSLLPWALRELGRERGRAALRTLFINAGRPALTVLANLDAKAEPLRRLGLNRSGLTTENSPGAISPDAHFYMFLGDPMSDLKAIPVSSILPHTVAMDDGTYWRDFDEKALKGFKRHFPRNRLDANRGHLTTITSHAGASAFAFLLPAHFERKSRREALARLRRIDLVVVEMTARSGNSDVTGFIQQLLDDLEECRGLSRARIMIVCDCPLRWSYLRRGIATRRDAGRLGTRMVRHKLLWRSREIGFATISELRGHPTPRVELLASEECMIAGQLWNHAQKAEDVEFAVSGLKRRRGRWGRAGNDYG